VRAALVQHFGEWIATRLAHGVEIHEQRTTQQLN